MRGEWRGEWRGAHRGKKGDEAQRGVIGTTFMSSLYFPTTFTYDMAHTKPQRSFCERAHRHLERNRIRSLRPRVLGFGRRCVLVVAEDLFDYRPPVRAKPICHLTMRSQPQLVHANTWSLCRAMVVYIIVGIMKPFLANKEEELRPLVSP